MESRARLFGHAVHPMLIVFPLGLLTTAVVFDIVGLITGELRWHDLAYYLIAVGVIGGLAAALAGWIDWAAIPGGTRAKRIGLVHGVGNVIVVALFILSWLLRREAAPPPPTTAVVASVVGLGLAVITGWLGGELVERLGVGVYDGAHLDAPSSLSQLPASLNRRPAPKWSGPERRKQAMAWSGVERRAVVAR
ncbi:MAG TPA: DUF2231 domain-containing protein [Gemmatimonadales bacterium]|jgi:uncharacterized membrane protein|nr:DUF2231 domain-containing protein [Gemmatimonadales bacterium]